MDTNDKEKGDSEKTCRENGDLENKEKEDSVDIALPLIDISSSLESDSDTVNREIFVVKIFSWIGSTTKIKHAKIFLQRNFLKHVCWLQLNSDCLELLLASEYVDCTAFLSGIFKYRERLGVSLW